VVTFATVSYTHLDVYKRQVLERGVPGQTYNIGGRQEMSNLDLVQQICIVLDELKPTEKPYASLITFVKDRPGHDRRYAMNTSKIERELGWQPRETFAGGLRKTIPVSYTHLWHSQGSQSAHPAYRRHSHRRRNYGRLLLVVAR